VEEGAHVVGMQDGSQVRSRVVIIATGVSYRRLGIADAANVHVRYRSEVTGGGDGRLEHPLIRDRDSGRTESRSAAGLFILTGPDTAPQWPLARAPLPFETTAPGVFAVGDVRYGSVKRVASAVGEGSVAIRLVHDYLALPEHVP